MDYDAAQQHWLNTMCTQRTLMRLSNDPHQFRREPPLVGPFRQAYQAWSGQGEQRDFMTCPF
ncbi:MULTISPECIES: hypothetical protein [Mycobacterium]|uniref:hypothetical protein n=1 Tax=Mycobacterium TaxID=1763 RepID=UPI0007A008D9|nr:MULTISPECIES: hypothetical protein [Mycobacterium]MCV7100908.1 hypothetical protein [Mycobacterium palustre]MDV3215723.1 hypothetical protein [Mycobacterium avium]